MQQHTLMEFDPATGTTKPYPSHADQWRRYHGNDAWLFNPWTGARRHASDVGSDTFGQLIVPPKEPVYADSVDAILSVIPTREDGVTCHIEDVRKALAQRQVLG